jgi:exonuclease III
MKLLSWNVSQFSNNITYVNLFEQLVDEHKPDIIALQEYPSNTYFEPKLPDYTRSKTMLKTHADFVVTFVKSAKCLIIDEQVMENSLILAVFMDDTPHIIINGHLPPFKENHSERRNMMLNIHGKLQDMGYPMIWIGDSNMRQNEVAYIVKLTGYNDAYMQVCPTNKTKKFTWDGYENMFHGKNEFKFRCRFDICLYNNHIKCTSFDLVKGMMQKKSKQPAYISDHYGILVGF